MSRMTARRERKAGRVRRWFGGRAAVLLALAMAAGTPAAVAVAQGTTRTISNVATLDWTNGAQSGQLASNRIDTTVTALPPRSPIIIRTTNSAFQDTVSEGDLIQYRVTAQNTDGTQASGRIVITSRIPDGLRLAASSLRFEGAPLAVGAGVPANGAGLAAQNGPSAGVANNVLTITGPALAPGATV